LRVNEVLNIGSFGCQLKDQEKKKKQKKETAAEPFAVIFEKEKKIIIDNFVKK
jgi:hypothetical protein